MLKEQMQQRFADPSSKQVSDSKQKKFNTICQIFTVVFSVVFGILVGCVANVINFRAHNKVASGNDEVSGEISSSEN
jgi:heme/copper-type cytochrome/quinol oxidase subunit 2